MNFMDVARLVAPFAPALGGILGGLVPLPGMAIAGRLAGSAVAAAFGVPNTPDAIGGAIQSNPNEVVLAKLTAATEEIKAKWAATAVENGVKWPAWAEVEVAAAHAMEVMLQEIGKTQRAELLIESKFKSWWRPAHGWALLYLVLLFGNLLAVAVIAEAFFSAPQLADSLAKNWPTIATLLGIPALVVGVNVWARSSEKTAAIAAGAVAPGMTVQVPNPPTVVPPKTTFVSTATVKRRDSPPVADPHGAN